MLFRSVSQSRYPGGQLNALDAIKAPINSPSVTGTPTAPTAAFGTATNQLATTAFVANQALSASLPSQAGNAGKFIGTDGTTASWQTVTAGATSFNPAGNISATNVQAAIAELDSDLQALAAAPSFPSFFLMAQGVI